MQDTKLPDFADTRLQDFSLFEKYQALKNRLGSFQQALIGFSGGVDSALLTGVARHVLGKDRVVAYLAVGPSLARQEQVDAIELAGLLDVRLEEYPATEFENPAYVANGPDRCFHCKTDLFVHLRRFARDFENPTLLYGGNADDTVDYRPGTRAARTQGAFAPLAEAGLTKAEVRALSRAFNLPTAEKSAQPCLSSRIPYGLPVNAGKLAAIEAGEALLQNMGFREYRLRHYDSLAKIEVPLDQFGLLQDLDLKATLFKDLKTLGFTEIQIDPQGFRSGSLNEALTEAEKHREKS